MAHLSRLYRGLAAVLCVWILSGVPSASGADAVLEDKVRRVVEEAVIPVMQEYGIPGMAVGVTIDGARHFIEFGLASKTPKVPVSRDTLFEIGSISKTFTATLATYAQAEGKLSLNDTVGQHLPDLKGGELGDVRLLDLGTHTAGGFPLQVPDEVQDLDQFMAYCRDWKPRFAPGTYRTYANPSIGLLGMIVAKSMGAEFETVAARLFRDLGLERTYINVPATEMSSYAWGHTRDEGKPIRVAPGVLASEAYGVKSNAVDMVRFLEANMRIGTIPEKVAGALMATHTGYYRAGGIIQDLIWEQYPYPVAVETIVAGNSPDMVLKPIPATPIEPPMAPRGDVILNKTGSTNGFGAYVAFVPGRKLGIVLLANRSYPNEARVRIAHRVLALLAE